MTADLLRDFIALALEIAHEQDMPLIEALDEAADLWPLLATVSPDMPAVDVLPFEMVYCA